MKAIRYVLLFLVFVVSLEVYFYFSIKNSLPKVPVVKLGSNSNVAKNTEPTNDITLILGGDIMLGRSVMLKSKELNNYFYPFEKVANVLQGADIAFFNLENPVVGNCPPHDSGFKFCSEAESLAALAQSGVDIVNLANNHTLNYGKVGFEDTKKLLSDNKILYVGDNNLVIKKVNNLAFGFLGFDFTVKEPSENDFELVRASGKKVDVLVVAVHWGTEYTKTANSYQQAWAKRMVENGADIIAGHHPHWVQKFEYLESHIPPTLNNTKPVYYSLGNFIFDQMWSEETKKGMIVKLTFEGNKIVREEKIPIYIKNIGQPEIVI